MDGDRHRCITIRPCMHHPRNIQRQRSPPVNKTLKYEIRTGRNGYIVATLVIEEQPSFYPYHITAPDFPTWCTRAKSVERRYSVEVQAS